MMPVRLSGSQAESFTTWPLGAASGPESLQRLRQSELLAHEGADQRPRRSSPCISTLR
jgi:hypothetical protein